MRRSLPLRAAVAVLVLGIISAAAWIWTQGPSAPALAAPVAGTTLGTHQPARPSESLQAQPASRVVQPATRGDVEVEVSGGSDEATAPMEAPDAHACARAALLLNSVADSFLTDAPDLDGFRQAVAQLATLATLDEASVVRDPRDGSVRGTLDFPGEAMKATFVRTGDQVRVDFQPFPGEPLDAPFNRRDISLSFLETQGRAGEVSASIQHHPNPRESPTATLRPDEERYAGWNLEMGPAATIARPLSVRASPDGTAWIAGYSPSLSPLEVPTSSGSGAYDAWLNLLGPHGH